MKNSGQRFLMALVVLNVSIGGVRAQGDSSRVMGIREVFELADLHSKRLRASAAGVNAAAAGVSVASNARLPEVSASASLSYLGNGVLTERDFSSAMSLPMPHLGTGLLLEAVQVVYAGGAVRSGIALARLHEGVAKLEHEGARNELRLVLAGYYLDLFKLRNLLRVYDLNIAQARLVLKDLQAKSAEGIMLRNDITRYELLIATLELDEVRLRNSVSIIGSYLNAALGLPDGLVVVPDTSLLRADFPLPAANDSSWSVAAALHVSGLKALELGVEMDEVGERLARAELKPQVVLVAGGSLDGPITVEVPAINKNFGYWYVGVGVKYRLSALYTAGNSINRSRLATLHTRSKLDEAREQTLLAVNAELIRYREAFDLLRTQQKSVELATENYQVVSNRYRNDMALITDMLDASNAKLAAEVGMANAQIGVVFGYFRMMYASGTLVEY